MLKRTPFTFLIFLLSPTPTVTYCHAQFFLGKFNLNLKKVQGEFLWRSGPSDSKIHIINGNVVFSKSVENGWQLEPLNVEQGID